jgi:hypothetical protein
MLNIKPWQFMLAISGQQVLARWQDWSHEQFPAGTKQSPVLLVTQHPLVKPEAEQLAGCGGARWHIEYHGTPCNETALDTWTVYVLDIKTAVSHLMTCFTAWAVSSYHKAINCTVCCAASICVPSIKTSCWRCCKIK